MHGFLCMTFTRCKIQRFGLHVNTDRIQKKCRPTFRRWVVHAVRGAAHINFLIEVRLVVRTAAIFVMPYPGGRYGDRPGVGAHAPPCALLRRKLRGPLPRVRRSAGAQAAPVARFPLRFSSWDPSDSLRRSHHHHLLSALHHPSLF